MKNRIAVALFVLFSILTVAPRGSAQESAESERKILGRVAPQYPNLARSMNIKGSVRAVALVAPNGTVKSVEVKGGHPLLVDAAQTALRQWKFEPAPKESYEIIEIRFTP
jgi:TonB family protein